MRLPNGFGSVSKLSGNRRKPYMVRNSKGVILGYVKTRTEGIEQLVEYNQDPYDIDTRKITLSEIWEMYKKTNKFKKLAKSTRANLLTNYNKIEELYDKPYREIKLQHMQYNVDNAGSPAVQGLMKSFFTHLDLYARGLDITNDMYSELIITEPYSPKKKKIYTEKEISELWERSNEEYVQHLLILLYTGFRISEYLSLTIDQVNLEKNYIRAGIKTDSGKNRHMPIHHRIKPFIVKKTNHSDSYLFPNYQGYADPAREFRRKINKVVTTTHTLHETRHTFRTRLYNNKVDSVIINKLLGHQNKNVGEDVYTHLELEKLQEAIDTLN